MIDYDNKFFALREFVLLNEKHVISYHKKFYMLT